MSEQGHTPASFFHTPALIPLSIFLIIIISVYPLPGEGHNVNLFQHIDELAVPPAYSPELDTLSTCTAAGSMLLPLIPSIEDILSDNPNPESAISEITGYSLALSTAYVSTEILKNLVGRTRPFPGVSDNPGQSFPSRHTAAAFTAAAYNTLRMLEKPDVSSLDIACASGNWGLALATASLRVLSGEHYLSDVLAGALLGSLIGVTSGLLL